MQNAGNLAALNTKVLNADADKTGEPEEREGSLFNGTMDSTLGSLAPLSIAGLMGFAIFPVFLINRM